MKKKSIQLLVLLVVVITLVIVAMKVVKGNDVSDKELLDFAVADTSLINKVIISDSYNRTIELTRNKDGRSWSDANGSCVQQEPIDVMLETFKNLEFKGYVPSGIKQMVTNKMTAQNTKVEIFQKGKWVKTWYIGASTQDHYGTYMLLETPDIKSDYPVIMHMRGLNGIIEPRFFADKRKWACTQIFNLERKNIKEVNVRYNDTPTRSFNVKKVGKRYEVDQYGLKLKLVDTIKVAHYLNNFKNVNFELVNFELNQKQVDSLKKAMPFCVMSVKETSGKSHILKMYRMKGPGYKEVDDFGDSVSWDTNRFWLLTPQGEVVKAQYFAFGPMIMGHLYFGVRPEYEVVENVKSKK